MVSNSLPRICVSLSILTWSISTTWTMVAYYQQDGCMIESMLDDLQTKLELTRVQGDLSAFLGIQIRKSPTDALLTLTQEGRVNLIYTSSYWP